MSSKLLLMNPESWAPVNGGNPGLDGMGAQSGKTGGDDGKLAGVLDVLLALESSGDDTDMSGNCRERL